VPGLDADGLLALLDAPQVTEAYEADRAEARTAEGSPTAFQGKAAQTDGPVRYTAPSLVFETADGRRLEAGGFQPLEAYDVLVANLGPTLERRGPATGARELLDAFPHGLTTREVAVAMWNGLGIPDDAAAEDTLLDLVASGDATQVRMGDGELWLPADERFVRDDAQSASTTTTSASTNRTKKTMV
jgi:hypothetical protein